MSIPPPARFSPATRSLDAASNRIRCTRISVGYSDPVSNTDPSGRDPWWTDPNDPSANCTNPRVEYGVGHADYCNQKQCHYDDFVANPGDGDVHCNISVSGGTTIAALVLISYLCWSWLSPAVRQIIAPATRHVAPPVAGAACRDSNCWNEAEQIIGPVAETADDLIAELVRQGTKISVDNVK